MQALRGGFFSPENVIARVYDTALFKNNSVVHDLLAQIGCASSDLPPQDSEFTNSSLGAASCALLTDPRLEHWRRDKAFRAAIRRALDDKSFSSPGQRRLLSKAQMDRIRERFEQNNRKLVDEFVVGDTGNFLAPPPDDADLGFQTSREQFSLDDIIRLLTEIQKIQTRIRNERDLARDERERALRKLDLAKRHPWKSFRNALRGLHQDG